MKYLTFVSLCFLVACSSTMQVVPTTTMSPSALPPFPGVQPISTTKIVRSFTPIPSATPWVLPSGLSIEEHPLAKRPEIEPMVLYPLDNLTQEQMFAKHASEFQKGLRPESYYGLCGCTLWVMQANDKLETFYNGTVSSDGKASVGVTRNGKVIFSTLNDSPGVTSDFRVLATYDNHWALELAEKKDVQGSQEIAPFFQGKVFIDGKSLNEIYGYEESYGFQTIHGRPFYFYKKIGKIGISYDGKGIPLGFDGVPHYGCCSAGAMNPHMAENMIAFFAWRGDQWYYVELGAYIR